MSQDRKETAEPHGCLKLVTEVLRSFTARCPGELDAGIDDALRRIGTFTAADRSYLLLRSADGGSTDSSHEWCATGVEPRSAELAARDATDPGRSSLVVPLLAPDRSLGVIGIDAAHRSHGWPPGTDLLLRSIADAIVGGLLRREASATLAQRDDRYRASACRSSEVVMNLGPDNQATGRGRARMQLPDGSRRDRAMLRRQLGRELRAAFDDGQLELVYQPLFGAADGRLLGAEALLRWNHPTRGRIEPEEFVTVAEENGLIVPIGAWVVGEALRQSRSWQDAQPWLPPVPVSVNVSVHQLGDRTLPTIVRQRLLEHDIAPSQLCLELTESALMAEPDVGLAVLTELRQLGVGLALDDFGTGYSSLAALRRLPVTSLKIDRSFVAGVGSDDRDARVIATVIALATEFGLTTVAEGVETAEQLARLRGLGCDLVQGYHLMPPVSARSFEQLRVSGSLIGSQTGSLTGSLTGSPAGSQGAALAG